MSSFHLRPATPQDAATVAAHRSPERAGGQPPHTTSAAWVEDALTRGVDLGWLAEHDGKVIGGAGLILLEWGPTRDDPSPLRARVRGVFTVPEWRRRGVARALLDHALDTAKARGLHTLSLGTTDQARTLSQALGFQASPPRDGAPDPALRKGHGARGHATSVPPKAAG
ncbi:acetyltransferase, N-acetylglutamate synthase [Deinococcus aerius]|uniref:Acetyltransferase, N-acetylglutamate synthase n=1 Tax=Deinococcus aerius TaxID=200253 RepID=A0A2I9CSM4_9DEIO|nr:GNAT family N-acetyltransferase [Deinococcus aerius]GBF04669.1 acetyltransferase, N-acetylglutamate synthase [Deinococcus aerius]